MWDVKEQNITIEQLHKATIFQHAIDSNDYWCTNRSMFGETCWWTSISSATKDLLTARDLGECQLNAMNDYCCLCWHLYWQYGCVEGLVWLWCNGWFLLESFYKYATIPTSWPNPNASYNPRSRAPQQRSQKSRNEGAQANNSSPPKNAAVHIYLHLHPWITVLPGFCWGFLFSAERNWHINIKKFAMVRQSRKWVRYLVQLIPPTAFFVAIVLAV